MPGQQGSSTPPSTGSESLRANAAEFVPKLRATATAFVPSGGSYMYAQPRMQMGMSPIRQGYYAPRQHRMDVPGLVPNPGMMNPMMSMGQGPYHFQHGFMGAPVPPQFHPGMPQGSIMPMYPDSQSSRRRTLSPSKPKEQLKESIVAAQPVPESSTIRNLKAADGFAEGAPSETISQQVVESVEQEDPVDAPVSTENVGSSVDSEQHPVENHESVSEEEAAAQTEGSSSEQTVDNPAAAKLEPESGVASSSLLNVEVESPAAITDQDIPSVDVVDNCPIPVKPNVDIPDEPLSKDKSVGQSDSMTMDSLDEAKTDSVAQESRGNAENRYTVDQLMEVRARLQAEIEANRQPPAVVDPARYSVQEIMAFQSKFNDTPSFTNPSLDCIGSPLASRSQGGGGSGGARDRRSSVDRRGYHGSSQRDRGAKGYEKVRSRDTSRSREISRANFGHLQGTVKPIEDDRGSRRRNDRERDRFDGPVRAPEPVYEPLAVTENRYVVKKDVQGEELALRQVQSVLNKLTPEKFDRLVSQLIDLIMNHLDHLEKIIGLVFDKAVNEFNFAHMYSDLCHCLHKRLAGQESEVGRFRVILLERCRMEFESRSQFPEKIAAMAEEDRETAVFLARRRSRGLLTFIGHLFNRQLLHFQVINRCLASLTPHTSIQCGRNIEWDIEDTCTLWTVMGKKFASFRNEDVQKVVDVSFQIIENVIEAREVSSRMIFMLKDLVDLRNNRWEPRREIVVASTLAEVHKKAAQEALAKERAAQKADRSERRRRDDRDPRFESRRTTSVALGNTFGSGDGRSRVNIVDGWSQKVSKGKRGAGFSDQPIRGSHSVKDLKSYQSAARSAETVEPKQNVNAYTLLTHTDEEEETQSPGATSDEIEGEESAFEASGSDLELQPQDVDENAIRDKIKRMTEEFISIEDYKEVLLATADLHCPALHHLIVSEALALAAEGKPRARKLVPSMILHLFKEEKLSSGQIIAGLSEFLEILEDLEIDIPKIRNHTGEFIAEFILAKALPISYLADISNFRNIPLKTLQAMDSDAVPDLIREDNVDLYAILSPSFKSKEGDDLNNFLAANGLESLVQCLR